MEFISTMDDDLPPRVAEDDASEEVEEVKMSSPQVLEPSFHILEENTEYIEHAEDLSSEDHEYLVPPPPKDEWVSSQSTPTFFSVIPCILCQKTMQPEGQYTPFLLECGHILCAECLRNVSTINDATSVHQLIPPTFLKCSDCFCMSSLPLTKNYPLIRTLIKQASNASADIVCEVCREKQAVIECSDCQRALCEDCDDSTHSADMESEDHVRELIDMNTLCMEHCKVQHLYCLKCSTEVCPDCITVGAHSQHPVQSREELQATQNSSLNVLASSTESNLQTVVSLIELVHQSFPNKSMSKNLINKAFEDLHTLLHSRRQTLLQEIEMAVEQQTEQCERQIMQLSAIREDCVGSLAELAQCLGTQAPAPPTALVSAPPEKWCGALKNAILTADEYAAITSRLQTSCGVDVSTIGPPPDLLSRVTATLDQDVAAVQEIIAQLGRSSSSQLKSKSHDGLRSKGSNIGRENPPISNNRSRTKSSRAVAQKSYSPWSALTQRTDANEEEEEEEEEEGEMEMEMEERKAGRGSAKVSKGKGTVKTGKDNKIGKEPIVHLGRHRSGLSFSKLKVGDKIDCLDSSNRWAEAKIVEICKKSKQILVTYLYWGSEWDEWVSDFEYGIAPLKTHTYYAGGPLEKGFRVEVLHDGVWREGFVMETKGDKIKVYYEDFSNTTQQKWVSPRDDVIRQFGLYQLGSGGSSPGGGDSDSDNDGDGDGDNSHQNNPRQKKSGSVKKKNTQAKKRKRGEGKNNCHM